MLQNDLLIRTLKKEQVERPPIWLMRQAGRILPEYRAIRSSLSGFKELVSTPDLAAEVTIQPVDRLNVDAAIIFSDILVIPEAMGLDYELIEKKGPWFPKTIESKSDIEKLVEGEDAASNLQYVYNAVSETKKRLEGRVPLIVFSGAPWTLFAYMLEGSGSKTFSKAKRFLYAEPALSHQLLSKITSAIISYLEAKLEAGGDVVQLFDSWTGILNKNIYHQFCYPYVKQIADHFKDKIPFIYFPRGAHYAMEDLRALELPAMSVDWSFDPQWIRSQLGDDIVLQGNLDPVSLFGKKELIEEECTSIIKGFGRNHVFNLGHGVYPDTPLDHVIHMVKFVKNISYD